MSAAARSRSVWGRSLRSPAVLGMDAAATADVDAATADVEALRVGPREAGSAGAFDPMEALDHALRHDDGEKMSSGSLRLGSCSSLCSV